MIDSDKRLKTVSQYVTRPVERQVRIVTALVTSIYLSSMQRVVPASERSSSMILRVDTAGNTLPLLEELKNITIRYPKSDEIYLTDHSAYATAEEEYDGEVFRDILPESIRSGPLILKRSRPLFYFRRTLDGRIIASNEPIRGAKVRGYLIERHLAELGVNERNYRFILAALGLLGKYFRREPEDDDELRNELAGIKADYLVTFNPELGRAALKRWNEFLNDVLFKGADEFIVKTYIPTVPPFNAFRIRFAANVILGAPTGCGKTTLAAVLGQYFERITEATLIGGKFGDLVSEGITHNFDGLVQIESLERETLKTIVGGLLEITSTGRAYVGTYGTKIENVFKGPVYVTFNTQGGTQRVIEETLAKVASAIAINPEALARRFVLLASRFVLPLQQSPLIYQSVSEIVEETIRAVRFLTRDRLANLLDEHAIINFISNVRNEINELPDLMFNSNVLKVYYHTLQEVAGEHAARLGLCATIAKHLDDVYKGVITRNALLRKAEEEAIKYGEMIGNTLREIGDLLDESTEAYILNLPKNRERKFIYAIIVALYNTTISKGGLTRWGAVRKGEALEVKVEELFNHFKETRLYANISLPKFTQKLKTPAVASDPALSLISFNYSEEKGTVLCDLSQLLYVCELLGLKK